MILMADDVVFLVPGQPPMRGKGAFAASQSAMKQFDMDATGEIQEIKVTAVNCHVRACGPGDEHPLALVGQATFLDAFAGVLSGEDILLHCAKQHAPEVYTAWLSDPRARAWLAEIEPGNAPVGYLVVAPASLPLPDLRNDDIEVKRIYLLHRVQGTGLGKRLMKEAVDYAVQAGGRRLLLGVYGGNDHAIAFYERFGFTRVGTRRFRVGNSDYDDLILGLDLG
jgi:ribosomal protein S18 acetylase RimI-like enzyme